MANVLELFEEAISVARELGFMVREEPLGDLPGGACMANGKKQLLLNASMSPADQLDVLLKTIGSQSLCDIPLSGALTQRMARVQHDAS